MKRRLFSTLLLIALITMVFSTVSAQSYSFSVPTAVTELYINTDGTATIRYLYEFQNEPGAPAIEYVDVGLPTKGYSLNNVQASVNGNPVTSITYADPDYIKTGQGVTVELGSLSIPAGQSGTFELTIFNITDLLYVADEPENYASFVFMPNYFGSEYVNGKTNYTMYIFMPPGLANDEPRYFPAEKWPGTTDPTENGISESGRIYYMWNSVEADLHSNYQFGGALPQTYIPTETLNAPPTAMERFAAFIEGAIEVMFPICCGSLFVIGPIAMGIIGSKQQNKRKLKYLPPKVRIEGHGIKRGLTAVQAAVLLEKPMDEILTMILFSTIRKGGAEVIQEEPLKIKAIEPAPSNLYPYEKNFIAAMLETKVSTQRKELQTAMVKLIKSVNEKMKGFSYKETVTYYEDIVARAWGQVENADTPDIAMENFDKYMPWAMLDEDYQERTKEVFTPMRPVYMPIWWSRYRPSYGRSTMSRGSSSASSSGRPMTIGGKSSLPSLPGAEFASGIVLGAQGFATNTIGNLTSFTERITNKTNPIPKPSPSSGGGRSGGSSCACACAGCACACAGGGR